MNLLTPEMAEHINTTKRLNKIKKQISYKLSEQCDCQHFNKTMNKLKEL